MPGAADLFSSCRSAGIRVCLATGFSPATRDAITNDVESGLRAGAGLAAGVLTGSSTRQELAAVPAITGLPGEPLVLDSIAGLLPHLGI